MKGDVYVFHKKYLVNDFVDINRIKNTLPMLVSPQIVSLIY